MPGSTRVARLTAGGAATASVGWLIHDLGRPERFLHMLRVLKPTSPLQLGHIRQPYRLRTEEKEQHAPPWAKQGAVCQRGVPV